MIRQNTVNESHNENFSKLICHPGGARARPSPAGGGVMSVEAAFAAFKTAQRELVDALQMEYFCDDITPPDGAYGWAMDDYVEYFKSGGETLPAAAMPPPPPAPVIAAATVTAAPTEDEELMAFLDAQNLAHMRQAMKALTWDECDSLIAEGRPKIMAHLGKLGVSLPDRQKFATAFAKASKPAIAKGQPGGGREQPAPFELVPLDLPGRPMAEVALDVKGYQEQVLRDGIPPRMAGLFPPGDELLSELVSVGWRPATKGLPHPTKDGGVVFTTAERGWACGEGALEHGFDLRWFIMEGLEDRTLSAAVRFSEEAMIGRGIPSTSVHGGAVETCLDEATAELAKSKLFPMATTAKIEFKISKPIQPRVTYRVHCRVEKEYVAGVSYDVVGQITDAKDHKAVYAVCTAKMANPFALG